MLIHNLGSGSAGNATVVAQDGRAILIDAGLGIGRMKAGLEGLNLEAVLITHVHSDHISGLSMIHKRFDVPAWFDAANLAAAKRKGFLEGRAEVFDGKFRVGPFQITPFPLPHPGYGPWNSFGFRIECGRRRLAYATDLGCVPPEALDALSDAHVVFLESNHDREMELTSDRDPDHIDWVLSDDGHLSNDQCAEALGQIGRPHTVILGHLSQECNEPGIALRCAARALRGQVRVLATSQQVATCPVTI